MQQIKPLLSDHLTTSFENTGNFNFADEAMVIDNFFFFFGFILDFGTIEQMGNCNTCKARQQEVKTEINNTENIDEAPKKPIYRVSQLQQRSSIRDGQMIQKVEQNGVKKRAKAAFLINQDTGEVKDNVKIYDRGIQAGDIDEIKKTLKHHFIFSQLPQKELDFVVKNMRPCSADANSYIFKQGDVASSYYIILEGSCIIEINNCQIRKLGYGDSFGDLGIIYQAPRSASVKALEDCQFAEIGREAFRKVTDEINSMYEAENKSFLQVLSFYSDLTEDQKNAIASACLTETYEEGQTIFNRGDDGNSIYIIKKGRVLIKQKAVELGQRESFGENCLLSDKLGVRSNTIIAKTSVQMISISRQIIGSSLGGNIKNTLKRNVIKKIISSSALYKAEKADKWNQAVQAAKIINFKGKEIVIAKGTVYKDQIFVVISSDISGLTTKFQASSIIELQSVIDGGELVFKEDFTADRDGELFKLVRPSAKEKQEEKEPDEDQNHEITKIEKRMAISDFYMIRELRGGNFGQVYACYNPETQKLYAIKVLERATVEKDHLIQYIMNEEEILRTAPKHPFLVNFYKLIKDANFIYFVMDFIAGEDMFDAMSKINIFNERKAKFIASQILLLIEHLHASRIIYRDLKPENLMVRTDGYLTLVDMGTAKRLKIERRYRTKTIIGTPHYMAPEIILGKGYSFQVDLWSFGVMLYEMMCGRLPFGELSEDPFTIYEEVMSGSLKYPRNCPKAGKAFIEKLLSKNPQHRLGSGYEDLKKNQFFMGIDWKEIINKEAKPVYIPDLSTSISAEEIKDAIADSGNKANIKIMLLRKKQDS